jgi:haloalkane dehalogenase
MEIDFSPDRSLYPFESRWFGSSRGRVHYIDEGAGPPLLLCHGNPTWSFLYRHIVRALRDRFRCVAIDYLGFGLSERPEGYGYTIDEHAGVVGELVDDLALEGFVVMGQDWGEPIAPRSRSTARTGSGAWCSATPGSGPRSRSACRPSAGSCRAGHSSG